jgi:hypothetical protein
MRRRFRATSKEDRPWKSIADTSDWMFTRTRSRWLSRIFGFGGFALPGNVRPLEMKDGRDDHPGLLDPVKHTVRENGA